MKKLLVLFLAMPLAGCGKEPAAAPAPTGAEKKEAAPSPPAHKEPWRDYPKLSPFEAIRWRESAPEVRVRGVWYELLALNEIPSKEVVDFCRKTDKKNWQKRFDEDLVEVLIRMGHDPGKSATLKVRRLDSGQEQVLKDVPMTEENRKAIWKARNQRQSHGGPTGKRSDLPRLTRRQAEEDLDQLASVLEGRYAYLKRKGVDHRAALAAVRRGLGEGVSPGAFAIQLMKLLAFFGDGHTQVDGADAFLPAGYAPFLIGDADGRLVAFRQSRSGFLDPERPYLRSLDGVPIEKWLQAAGRIVPAGSPQFVRWHGIRNLRYVNYLRQELGLGVKTMLRVELESAQGRGSRTIEVGLAKEKPVYGDWPRGSHRVLAGDVGYLRIARMSDDPRFLRNLAEFMGACRRTRGLILDVRGNGGGSRAVLRELATFFLKREAPARVINVAAYRLGDKDKPDAKEGYLADRSLYPLSSLVWSDAERATLEAFARRFHPEWTPPDGEFSTWHYFLLRPRAGADFYHYERPVIVLMDAGCFSATDIFLGAWKGWPGVTLMGTASGGGSGRPRRVRLTHSGVPIRLSSMISFRANGELYDGRGILPDVEVPITATDLIGSTDTVLEVALKRLRQSTLPQSDRAAREGFGFYLPDFRRSRSSV